MADTTEIYHLCIVKVKSCGQGVCRVVLPLRPWKDVFLDSLQLRVVLALQRHYSSLHVSSPYVCILVFEIGSHVGQAGLRLTTQPRMSLIS